MGCSTSRWKMHQIRTSRPSSHLGGTFSIFEKQRPGIDKNFIQWGRWRRRWWKVITYFKILLLQIILNFSYQVGMENVAKTKNIQPELKALRVETPTLSRNRLQNILSSLWIPFYRNLSFISQSQFRYTTQKTQSTSYYRITSIYNRQNHHLRISMIKITYLLG